MVISMIIIFTAFDFASFITTLSRGYIHRDVILRYFSLKPHEMLLHASLIIIFSIAFSYWIIKPRRLPLGETYAIGSFALLALLTDVILSVLGANQLMLYSLERDPLGWSILTVLAAAILASIWIERYVRKNKIKSIFEFDPKMVIENFNVGAFGLFALVNFGILMFHPFHNTSGAFAFFDLIFQLLLAIDIDLLKMMDKWFFILVNGWRTLLMFIIIATALIFYYRSVSHHLLAKLIDPKKRLKLLPRKEFIRRQRFKLIGLALTSVAQTINDGLSIIFWLSIPLIAIPLLSKDDLRRVELYVLTSITAAIFASRWILTLKLDTSWNGISLFSIAMFFIILALFFTLVSIRSGYLVSIGLLALSALITYTFWDNYIYVFTATVLTILGVFWWQLLQNIILPSQALCNSGKQARSLLESEDIFWDEIKSRFSLSDELVKRIQSYVYSTLQDDREKVLEIVYEPEKPYNAVIFAEKTFYKAFLQSLLILGPIFLTPLVLMYAPLPALGLYRSPSVGNFAVLVVLSLYVLAIIIIWLPPVPIPKFREMELEYRRFKQ